MSLANSALGFNNWSTEIKAMNKTHASEVGGLYIYQYTCVIRVTLADGCFRESNGFGLGRDKFPYNAIELAQKAAFTDAMKRALKLLGNIFIADIDIEPSNDSFIQDKELTPKPVAPAAKPVPPTNPPGNVAPIAPKPMPMAPPK